MNNLLLIGNGFDMAHGLKTNYSDFIRATLDSCFENPGAEDNLVKISEYSWDYDSLISSVLHSDFLYESHSSSLITYSLLKDMSLTNWCDIESKYFELLSDIGNKEIYYQYDTPKLLNDDFQKIKDALEAYLIEEEKDAKQAPSYKELFSILGWQNVLGNSERIISKGNTCILNFNYTHTLDNLYASELKGCQIIPIHGQLSDKSNPIIFGYAANDDETKFLVDKNNNEYQRNIKRHNYMRTANERKLTDFLDGNKDIHVSILGHSCGLSDKLILEQIFNHDNIKSIRVYYYEDYEAYFQSQVNIYRIMGDNQKFKKVVNFDDCMRMPQHSDNAEQIDYIDVFHKKKNDEYKKEQYANASKGITKMSFKRE